jgi:hypothetical protein
VTGGLVARAARDAKAAAFVSVLEAKGRPVLERDMTLQLARVVLGAHVRIM